MKNLILGISAVAGILGAVLLHGSFMTVEAVGSEMLPSVEPGQKVVVCLLSKEFEEGDLVAFEPPYYTVGGSSVMLRRISKIENDSFTLVCDAPLVQENSMKIQREDIIGKAIFYG